MRERDGQRHKLARFVAGVAEHHALVAGAVGEIVALAALLALERFVDAHCDIGGLLVDGREHRAGLAVKAELRAVVADVAHNVAHDLRDIDVAARGDLAHDENKTGRGGAFACDVAVGVLFENGVEHRVGDLVADLVGVAFGDAFGCEEIVCHGVLLKEKISPRLWPGCSRAYGGAIKILSFDFRRRIWHLMLTHRLSGFTGPFPPPLLISRIRFGDSEIYRFNPASIVLPRFSRLVNAAGRTKPWILYVLRENRLMYRIYPPE